jgi:hypothetical protein
MNMTLRGIALLERWEQEKKRKAAEEKLLKTGFFRRGDDGQLWHLPKSEYPRCGAKTRAGGTCQMRVVMFRKRCRLHGGLSTGPTTPEGRAAIADSNRRRAKK